VEHIVDCYFVVKLSKSLVEFALRTVCRVSNQGKSLGRGLSALISSGLARSPTMPGESGAPRTLPLTAIQKGSSQPRRHIEQQPLEELAASIKANGVIQPILVRAVSDAPDGAPSYEIVAGERRWQAAALAGLPHIPVVIRELSDQEAVAIALIENIQREDLTPAEEARALQRLATDFELTHQAVADAVGRSRAAVSNLIRLLDLPDTVVSLVDSKALSMGHARALLGLADDAERTRFAHVAVERGLTVRAVETLVRKALEGKGRGPSTEVPSPGPDLSVVSEVLKTPSVRIQLHQRSAGSGKLIVEFTDTESRDAILQGIKTVIAPR
jgi:ParB family chromosome partitioning protein